MRVTGIGGFFFRSKNPQALRDFYTHWFGIPTEGRPWDQDEGMTIFAPFSQEDDYFPTDRLFMLNLRVEGLAEMIITLRDAGVPVETRPEWDGTGEYGLFARVYDPDGNPIELWEPPHAD